MHPLRFSNSGIRAKVFVRKIGFKLRVMRLNRIESFYAFLLYFRSKRSKEEAGRPATARPPAGAAGHDLATFKGAGDCGQGPLQRGYSRLQCPPAARPQGSATRGEAIGAVHACGQPIEGRCPLPA
ncbi:hypothetical protein B296_00022968 [Ensete ventricosum]|uniref:Uncharacterized protein n=1 Tax=Ensete ventricosum TaxID=4639 RepID=A0A426WX83_ENSVE|nr:hypothetical protein B296_00022968 [Ensete ventricosum]